MEGGLFWNDMAPQAERLSAAPQRALRELLGELASQPGVRMVLVWSFPLPEGPAHLEAYCAAVSLPALDDWPAPPFHQAVPPLFAENASPAYPRVLGVRAQAALCSLFPTQDAAVRSWDDLGRQAGVEGWRLLSLAVAEELAGIAAVGLAGPAPPDEQLLPWAAQAAWALAYLYVARRAESRMQWLHEVQERCRELIDLASDAIFILDPRGRLLYANPQAERLTGYGLDSLLGLHFLRLIAPAHRQGMLVLAERVLAGKEPPPITEFSLLTAAGQEIPVEISIAPLQHEDQVEQVEVIVRDIRERRRQEQVRDELLARSQAMSRRLHLAFRQLGAALSASYDLRATLDLIVHLAAEILQADLAALWLLEPDHSWLSLSALHGEGDMTPLPEGRSRVRVGEGFIGRVLAEARPIYTVEGGTIPTSADTIQPAPASRPPALSTCVGVPMLARGEPLGVLAVVRRRLAPFSEPEIELLTSFAQQAATALERARLFERLVHEHDQLNTIFLNSADGILVLDAEKRVVDANPALAKMLGCERQKLIGRPCWEALGFAEGNAGMCERLCPFLPVALDAAPPMAMRELLSRQGRRLMVSISYGRVYDAGDRLSKVIAIVRDVTQQAELERLRRDFVVSVSHELRTPLALIKGYVATLRRPDLQLSSGVRERFLDNIEEAANRLGRLIEDLMTVARLETGRLTLHRRQEDLTGLVRGVMAQATVQYPQRQFQVEIRAQPLWCWIDGDRIAQVLSNLVSNAVKFSPADTPIIVRLEQVGEVARVSVQDFGVGISPEHHEHLFEKFYRVESGLTREQPGLGLGLHIVKDIVEAHGGRAWVQSRLGEGSIFGFDLPLMEAPAEGSTAIIL